MEFQINNNNFNEESDSDSVSEYIERQGRRIRVVRAYESSEDSDGDSSSEYTADIEEREYYRRLAIKERNQFIMEEISDLKGSVSLCLLYLNDDAEHYSDLEMIENIQPHPADNNKRKMFDLYHTVLKRMYDKHILPKKVIKTFRGKVLPTYVIERLRELIHLYGQIEQLESEIKKL